MTAHTQKQFDLFMSQLQKTNQTLDFFCDFEKIEGNVNDIKLSLCMLNSLIGTRDLKGAVETIWKRDKTAFSVMPILIAVRDDGKKMVLNSQNKCVKLCQMFKTQSSVLDFIEKTGLGNLFRGRKIKDLVDYVFGIETGLDSNARKNRSGHIMEGQVAKIFKNNRLTFRQEAYSREWPAIARALGSDEKRFDFVVKSKSKNYLIEVNFYSGGGSKLNEVARSYSEIAPKINAVRGFEFVWITDGIGWHSAKNKLREAYNIIPSVYNLTNIGDFISRLK